MDSLIGIHFFSNYMDSTCNPERCSFKHFNKNIWRRCYKQKFANRCCININYDVNNKHELSLYRTFTLPFCHENTQETCSLTKRETATVKGNISWNRLPSWHLEDLFHGLWQVLLAKNVTACQEHHKLYSLLGFPLTDVSLAAGSSGGPHSRLK